MQRNHQLVYLDHLDASDDPELFQRLEELEQERFVQLELRMEGHLRRIGLGNMQVRMRRYAPSDLPAVIIQNPETEAQEKLRDLADKLTLWDSMEDIAKEAAEQMRHRPTYLSLNATNPLIQKLADLQRHGDANRRDDMAGMLGEIMTGIYNSAILYSHNLVTQHNAEVIHQQLLRLFDRLIAYQHDKMSFQQQLEQSRRDLIDIRGQQVVKEEELEHILVFMIAPFDDTYRPIEEAVRRIFERAPYYFQVQLARDYTYTSGLLPNVHSHMMRAHCFVAEISDLNPNVMFELGAVMLPDDSRPVLSLRSQDAQGQVPADLRAELYIPYGSKNDPVDRIEADIRKSLERDGRIIADDVQKLIERRKKRFLSRTLLEKLRRTRLECNEIKALMTRYLTVEDLLVASPQEISRATAFQDDFVLQAIQAELRASLT